MPVRVLGQLALRIANQHLNHPDRPELGRKVQRRLAPALVRHVQVQIQQNRAHLVRRRVPLAVQKFNKGRILDGGQYQPAHVRVALHGGHVQRVVAGTFFEDGRHIAGADQVARVQLDDVPHQVQLVLLDVFAERDQFLAFGRLEGGLFEL